MDVFRHEALVYGADAEFLAGLEPYVRAGLDAGEAVVAVLPQRNAELLRDRLGPAAADVDFIDATDWYRRPSTTIAGYNRVLNELDGERACVIGEVQFGDDPVRWADWTRYEAAINEAFRGRDAHVVCPYDARSLPAGVVEHARRTHPMLRTGPTSQVSPSYTDPRQLARQLAVPFPNPSSPPDLELRVDGEPQLAREAFTAVAGPAGLDEETTAQLVVALNEVVTNALLHGGGDARLRLWWRDVEGVVGAVTDDGPGVDDPLAGFRPPSTAALGGRGVWMARQLFDRVELEHTPDGFTVWLAARP